MELLAHREQQIFLSTVVTLQPETEKDKTLGRLLHSIGVRPEEFSSKNCPNVIPRRSPLRFAIFRAERIFLLLACFTSPSSQNCIAKALCFCWKCFCNIVVLGLIGNTSNMAYKWVLGTACAVKKRNVSCWIGPEVWIRIFYKNFYDGITKEMQYFLACHLVADKHF